MDKNRKNKISDRLVSNYQSNYPSQFADNAKMERMKKIAALQRDLYERINAQYLMPLKFFIKAKNPKSVTLAEHTRLLKLTKLLDTLLLSCEIQKKIVFWYSSITETFPKDFDNLLQQTINEMEKATLDIHRQWSVKSESTQEEPSSSTEKIVGIEALTALSKTCRLVVDMATIEPKITNLHASLETALRSLKQLIRYGTSQHISMGKLDLSECDVSLILLQFPLPYIEKDTNI